MTIRTVDLAAVTEPEIEKYHAHRLALHQERLPDDPEPTLEDTRNQFRSIPPFVSVTAWAIDGPDGALAATGDFAFWRTDHNQHLGQFSISVEPAFRGKGMGKALLAEIVAKAEAENRSVLITGTSSTVPSGDAFLAHIGARVGLESHTNQLKLAELDHALLKSWLADTPEGFTLGVWDGDYPEESLDELVALTDLFNQVPRGDLQMEDFKFTKEQLLEMEASRKKRGVERWTIFVRDDATGRIAGFTETTWNPHKPTFMHQGITAVWPEYRGKRLGRWIKAAMIEKILATRPDVTIIRTENADTNEAMLKINVELGFKPYFAEKAWQIETSAAKAYLEG